MLIEEVHVMEGTVGFATTALTLSIDLPAMRTVEPSRERASKQTGRLKDVATDSGSLQHRQKIVWRKCHSCRATLTDEPQSQRLTRWICRSPERATYEPHWRIALGITIDFGNQQRLPVATSPFRHFG